MCPEGSTEAVLATPQRSTFINCGDTISNKGGPQCSSEPRQRLKGLPRSPGKPYTLLPTCKMPLGWCV